jgi:hypothetical protein
MARGHRWLFICAASIAVLAVLFVAVRRQDSLAYTFANAPILIPGFDLEPRFKWVFAPAAILAAWSAFRLFRLRREPNRLAVRRPGSRRSRSGPPVHDGDSFGVWC